MTRVLDSLTTKLGKQHALIYLASGERVSLPTLCRVLHARVQLVPPAHTAPRS